MQTSIKWVVVAALAIATVPSLVTSAAAEEARERRLVQQVVDPGTGSRIRVYQTGPAAFTLEIAKDDVSVTKDVGLRQLVTTIRSGADTLVLTTEPTGLIVRTATETTRFTRESVDGAERLRDIVRGSQAVRRAAELVRGMALPAKNPLNAVLFATRATLLAAVDDHAGLAELTRTMTEATRTTRFVRVVDEGPGDCWNEYAKEAIAAYMEFEDCMKNSTFFERALGTCEAIYSMRAIGALAWWVKCVGLSNT